MQVERIREKDGKLELLVELTPAETSEEVARAALQTIAMRGLPYTQEVQQAGTSPMEFLKQQLGQEEAAFVVDEAIMRRRAPFALTASKVDIVGAPVYRCGVHADDGVAFKYQLVCVPVPAFSLSSYDPVAIEVAETPVTDAEIDAKLEALAKASSKIVTLTSHDTVQKGDSVELALETSMDGTAIPNLCSEGREYRTGTFAMPDAFDEAIIGMKVGETKTFTFEGPEINLGPDGKPIMKEYQCTATVKRLVEEAVPAVDDSWAATVRPGAKNLAELREVIGEEIAAEHADDSRREAQRAAAAALAKRLEGEISDLLYGVAVKEAREGFEQQLKAMGLTVDAFAAKEGMTPEQVSHSVMLQVRDQLQQQLALNAFAAHHKLAVNDADLEYFFESIAPGKAAMAQQDFSKDGRMYAARCAALRLKAAKKAAEEAEVTVIDAASAPDAPAGASAASASDATKG